jgi:hypothetical protein
MTGEPVIPAVATWGRRNRLLLAVFAPILIATGVSGLMLPAGFSPMSSVVAYDIFHIVFGTLGVLIVLGRSTRMAALFNLGFGLFDLYQAVAGVVGVFPAQVFGLRPADHVVHVLLGVLLVGFAYLMARSSISKTSMPAGAPGRVGVSP